MALTPRKTLGLALQEGVILAAEVKAAGVAGVISRAESFAFPEGLSLEDPAALGEALGGCLKGRGFSAKGGDRPAGAVPHDPAAQRPAGG